MIKPQIVSPGDEVNEWGKVFDAPLVVKGKTWLPLVQLFTWLIMSNYAGKRKPERTWLQRLGIGALTMPVMLGSEWCHNLAHAAAAKFVGKPVDAIRVVWGMPLLVYYDINDSDVTPRQHIIRALGGPLINLFFLPFIWLARAFAPKESVSREVLDVAAGTNIFLPTVGLFPIPGIDGGPLLKWSLVERGRTVEEADEVVRDVNKVFGAGMAAASGAAFKRKKNLLGVFLAMMAATALAIGFGGFKEQ